MTFFVMLLIVIAVAVLAPIHGRDTRGLADVHHRMGPYRQI